MNKRFDIRRMARAYMIPSKSLLVYFLVSHITLQVWHPRHVFTFRALSCPRPARWMINMRDFASQITVDINLFSLRFFCHLSLLLLVMSLFFVVSREGAFFFGRTMSSWRPEAHNRQPRAARLYISEEIVCVFFVGMQADFAAYLSLYMLSISYLLCYAQFNICCHEPPST